MRFREVGELIAPGAGYLTNLAKPLVDGPQPPLGGREDDLMRRIVGLALVTVVVTACTPAADPPPHDAIASEGPVLGEPSPTPSPEETLSENNRCGGLGLPPREGQVTFVRDHRLIGVSPDGSNETCLAELSSGDIPPVIDAVTWNPPADRVIVAERGISTDLSTTRALTGGPAENAVWSRPTGKSIVYISHDGRLMKRSSLGGQATNISFLDRHDDVTYHPAGTHIATTGLTAGGDYGLYLATNLGTDAELIARGEEARFITDLEFTQSGRELWYTARHGPKNWHLHTLHMGKDAFLDTVAKNEFGFEFESSDVFEFSPYAWSALGDCAAGEPDKLHVSRGWGIQIPDDLRDTSLRPVGWLPRQRLVVTSHPVGCSTGAPADIYVLSRQAPVLIAEDLGATAGIRAVVLPPPPPPGEEQEVVA